MAKYWLFDGPPHKISSHSLCTFVSSNAVYGVALITTAATYVSVMDLQTTMLYPEGGVVQVT